MRIATLNYYQASRGLETFLEALSSHLKKNHQLLLLSNKQKNASVRTPITLLQRLFLDQDSLKVCTWTFSILSKLSHFNPDIILVTNGGWQVAILRLWTWAKRKKLVVTGQSGPGWDDRWNLLWKPDIFACLTQRQLTWAKKASLWKKQKFALIPNGVDLTKFSPKGKKAKLALQKPIILMVAATEPSKRVKEGVLAVSKLKKGSLLLLGRGPLDKKINKLGSKLLGTKRFLHLSVPHSQMPKFYRAADLFTLCSVSSEAFGIVYLEAMAAGLPVVATDDESRREIVGRAGVFIQDPTNATEYAQAIKATLAKKWGTLPYSQAEKFSWKNIAQKYEKLFQTL